MIQIAPSSKAKDVGPKDDGEDWQYKFNIVLMKETTDWVVTSDNTIAEWNQDIRMGKDGSQWMTVDVSYTNAKVGGLTDADFLTSVTSTCTKSCVLTEDQRDAMDAGLPWGPESESESEVEEVQGFDDPCEVPTGVTWGAMCRMQELCGTDCAASECKWNWPSDDPDGMDSAQTKCSCAKCIDTDFFLN